MYSESAILSSRDRLSRVLVPRAVVSALCFVLLAPTLVEAQGQPVPNHPTDTVQFGAPVDDPRQYPDLDRARRFLENWVRPRYPGLYYLMDEDLGTLESNQSASDWVLATGIGIGISSAAAGTALALGTEEDDLRDGGAVMLVAGLTWLITSWVISAILRPDGDAVRRVFDPIFGPSQSGQ